MSNKLPDIGWEHGVAVTADKKKIQCNYCHKVISGGITRLKQHLAGVRGDVAACQRCPREIAQRVNQALSEATQMRESQKRKKEQLLNSLRDEAEFERHPRHYVDDYDEFDGGDYQGDEMSRHEQAQLRYAMEESRRSAFHEADARRHSTSDMAGRPFRDSQFGAGPSQAGPSRAGPSAPPPRSFSVRDPQRVSGPELRGIDPYMYRPPAAKQKKLKASFFKDKAKKMGKAISKFFYYNAIPFNAADSGPYYQVMIDTIAECGPGVVGPTGYQIGGSFLNEEVEELTKYLDNMKRKWPEYGCTIMCDGWSSQNKHPITNFMIYCDREMVFHKSVDNTDAGSRTADYLYRLMDKVVEEVGEQHIVQIVTDNEASYKAAGLKLMEKRKHLFWSPCAAHCIDLMLEDIGEIKNVKAVITDARRITSYIYNSDALVNLMRTFTDSREILRPGITRFATEYIAIESLLRHQAALKRMFSSHELQELSYSRNREKRGLRTQVSNLILTEQFWQRAEGVRAIMEPLIKVLKIVDQDKKPTLGVIYESMDRAKIAIKVSSKSWKKIWSIIDKRWETQLHRDLHAAAYFLNPAYQYSNSFNDDEEVRRGLKVVIKRIEPDVVIQAKALTEVKLFREARGEFGEMLTKQSRTTCLPAEWWYNYGESAPNLRKIAIKVLSQTCSSSGCERNWSTFALIHTKIRNRLAMKKLEQLVYVHYNLRLRVRNLLTRKEDDDYYNPIDLNHIFTDEDMLDSWIRESEQPLLSPTDEWLQEGIQELSGDDDRENEIGGSSRSRGRGRSGSVEPRTSGRAQDGRDSQASRGKGVYQGNSEEENSDSGSESSDSRGGSGGGGGGFSGGGFSGGGDDGGSDDGDEDDGRGGGSYPASTQVETQTWQKGHDRFYSTQDTDHGFRPESTRMPETNPADARRRYWDQLVGFPSEDSDTPDHAYEEVMRRRLGQGGQLGTTGPMLDVQMGRMNLGYGQPSSQPPPPLRRSRSSATSGRVRRDRPNAPPPRNPRDPITQISYGEPLSTSTSTGGYYDRDRHHHHGSRSYGSSSGGGYGYLDRASSGSMGFFDGDYGSNSSGTQISYPPNQQIYPRNSSNHSSQDTGEGFSFSFFFGPQYLPRQYEGEGEGEGFQHHRHSTYR